MKNGYTLKRSLLALPVLVLALALSACSVRSGGVEDEFKRQRAGLLLTVSAVDCAAPVPGKGTACVVEFDDQLDLPQVKVTLAPFARQFPAAFELEHGVERGMHIYYWVDVDASVDKAAMSVSQAASRLAQSAVAAQNAAIAHLGRRYHARVDTVENLQSYEGRSYFR